MKNLITCFIFCFIAGQSFPQALKTAEANDLYTKAMKYYKSGNYDSLAAGLEQVARLLPDHPGGLFDLSGISGSTVF